MLMRKITTKFLENLTEVAEILNYSSSNSSLNPSLAIISAVVITSITSFNKGLIIPTLILIISLLLIPLLKIETYRWFKTMIFIVIMSSIISLPLLFITPGIEIIRFNMGFYVLIISFEGLYNMLSFIVRVTAAASIFTIFMMYIGWYGVIEGLRGLKIPEEIVLLIAFFMKYVSIFLREILKILVARESRLLSRTSMSRLWFILSTVIGELVIRGYERAWIFEKALKARTFNNISPKYKQRELGLNDLMLLLLTFIFVVFSFIA